LIEITSKFHIMKQLTKKRKLAFKKTAISRLSLAVTMEAATRPTTTVPTNGGYTSGIPSCAKGGSDFVD
jgi:hypothetical protein